MVNSTQQLKKQTLRLTDSIRIQGQVALLGSENSKQFFRKGSDQNASIIQIKRKEAILIIKEIFSIFKLKYLSKLIIQRLTAIRRERKKLFKMALKYIEDEVETQATLFKVMKSNISLIVSQSCKMNKIFSTLLTSLSLSQAVSTSYRQKRKKKVLANKISIKQFKLIILKIFWKKTVSLSQQTSLTSLQPQNAKIKRIYKKM